MALADHIDVGRSKDYHKYRKEHHRMTKAYVDVDDPYITVCPSYKASRITEQTLMAYYHTKNAYNRINGISQGKADKYGEEAAIYAEAALSYADNQLETEYLEMKEIGELMKDPRNWY